MSEEESEKEFQRFCDVLVTRGFVRAYRYDDLTKAANFEFTPTGEQLRRHLRTLFDVPNTNPKSLTPNTIISLVMAVLLTPPPNEIR